MKRGSLRQGVGLLVLLALSLVAVALRVLIDRHPQGAVSLAWPDPSYAIFRWTAVAVAAIVGSSLAVSGVMLQALLRNPLASPFIMGISAGAGLGVMVAIYVGHVTGSAVGYGAHMGPAILGGVVALGVVYGLGQRRGWLDPISLLLVGVIVSTICGALIMFVQHLVPAGLRGDLTTWMMGHIRERVDAATLIGAGALSVVGVAVAMILGRAMDAATLGDDEARSVGLALGPLRIGLFLLASALTAVTVALAGPIGFVGLVAPHAARLILGPKHTVLVLGAALVGVVLVVGSDTARQALDFGGGRMPIGIFTALIGGPAFIWLLRSSRRPG
ncbi:MAG: iron ABC transporter permease [Planctomycetes bacterium]|nr:iron ABC transporter permease [Planctomycetota bacterium]